MSGDSSPERRWARAADRRSLGSTKTHDPRESKPHVRIVRAPRLSSPCPMSDHYIYPSELAVLLAFVFAPPLLIALLVQASLFASRGVFRSKPGRALCAFAFTALVSLIVGTAVLFASPDLGPFSSMLGLTELRFSGHSWPVLPLAFVAVGIVAPIAAWWATRAA